MADIFFIVEEGVKCVGYVSAHLFWIVSHSQLRCWKATISQFRTESWNVWIKCLMPKAWSTGQHLNRCESVSLLGEEVNIWNWFCIIIFREDFIEFGRKSSSVKVRKSLSKKRQDFFTRNMSRKERLELVELVEVELLLTWIRQSLLLRFSMFSMFSASDNLIGKLTDSIYAKYHRDCFKVTRAVKKHTFPLDWEILKIFQRRLFFRQLTKTAVEVLTKVNWANLEERWPRFQEISLAYSYQYKRYLKKVA